MVRSAIFVGGLSLVVLSSLGAHAQDVPGIEICTVEKTMERRTSCLQSNINFLQDRFSKQALDYQKRLDAANRQIEALSGKVVELGRSVDALKVTQADAAKNAADSKAKPAQAPSPAAGEPPKGANTIK